MGETPRGLPTASVLLAIYAALGWIVHGYCQDGLENSAFWPANGVVVAGILVLPRRLGRLFWAVCLILNIAENTLGSFTLGDNLMSAVLNSALCLGAAFLARTFCGAATDLSRTKRLVSFAIIAFGSAATEAGLGDLMRLPLTPHFDFFDDWLQWTLCDGLGLLLATPAVLLSMRSGRAMYATNAGVVERWLLLGVITAVALIGLSQTSTLCFALIYPLLILVGFRAGPPWVLAAVMLVALPAAGFAAHGVGPIPLLAGPDPLMRQDMVQLFLISVFLCAVPATNALAERNRTAQRLMRIHAAAKAARLAAEAANYAKSQFIANMSHEIRTPLNGVLGMTQVMAGDTLSAVQRERLDVIRRSGEILLAILNDVLDLSKIEAGKLRLEVAPFPIEDLASGAMAAFTVVAENKGLGFCLEIEPDAAGSYLGDSIRVRQLLYNLISNALKFTETGRVSVSIRGARPGLAIEVRDTGIGIPADRLANLFQKFEQADVSTTRRFGGTGLGLAICRELAELMGGSVSAESVEGVGSCFRVNLPLDRPAPDMAPVEAPRATAASALPHRDTPPHILVAEDNKVNQLVLNTLLGQLGADCVVVEHGLAAVEAWRTQDWDLILMDMQMPVMDGLAAAAAIRDEESQTGRRRTPIVALTANVMAHQIRGYLAAGMDACVAKPIEVSQLVEVISTVLDDAGDDHLKRSGACAA
jgi:signal transduction histidine kinase/ActR/RegA family two-component response regulator